MTNPLSLRYRRARSSRPGSDLRLVFGGSGVAPPPPPPPAPPPPLVGALRSAVAAPWMATAAPARRAVAAAWRGGVALGGVVVAMPWGTSRMRGSATATPWVPMGAVRGAAVATPWGMTRLVHGAVALPWSGMLARHAALAAPWHAAQLGAQAVAAVWHGGVRVSEAVAAPWHAAALGSRGWAVSASAAQALRPAWAAPWQVGLGLSGAGGPWVPPEPPPLPPPETCRSNDPGADLRLLFRRGRTLRERGAPALLRFGCHKPALIVVPIRRVYVITNAAILIRVSDGASVPALTMQLSLDVDSWTWGFTAEVAPAALPMITPEPDGAPVALEATINGSSVRVVVESISRERTFGGASIRVRGRGIAAALADPYQPVAAYSNSAAMTTQQLLEQVLPAGWTADYGLTPWAVPAGLWSHQGTPMSAAVAIAAAGGGYVQPAATAQQLIVLPRYPAPPWEWSGLTPDVQLPSAVVHTEGIEWLDRPRYNRVYVSGTQAGGVLGRATRLGTAGDLAAPMVVDPLTTHALAVRQRGLPVLADTGRQALVTLRLPLLSATGILTPGRLVRYVDGPDVLLGLVRAVTVSRDGLADVWQSIKVETHVG